MKPSVLRLKIKDAPGKLPVDDMRMVFESVMGSTEIFGSIPLEPTWHRGVFTGYEDPETHAIWFGFATGMRISERIQRATSE